MCLLGTPCAPLDIHALTPGISFDLIRSRRVDKMFQSQAYKSNGLSGLFQAGFAAQQPSFMVPAAKEEKGKASGVHSDCHPRPSPLLFASSGASHPFADRGSPVLCPLAPP